jgi:hypothetical protein
MRKAPKVKTKRAAPAAKLAALPINQQINQFTRELDTFTRNFGRPASQTVTGAGRKCRWDNLLCIRHGERGLTRRSP